MGQQRDWHLSLVVSGQAGHCGDTFHRLNWSAGYLGQLATWDRWCQSQGKRADSQGAPGEKGCLTSGDPGGPLWACCDWRCSFSSVWRSRNVRSATGRSGNILTLKVPFLFLFCSLCLTSKVENKIWKYSKLIQLTFLEKHSSTVGDPRQKSETMSLQNPQRNFQS